MTATLQALLLDTCAAIFIMENQPIATAARAAMYEAGAGQGLFVSPVSGWEVGLLARRSRRQPMVFLPDPQAWFARLLGFAAIRTAPFTAEMGIASAFLPGALHSDPADRLLIATARQLDMPIMTRDRQILAYAEAGYVKAIPC